jgi:L-fuculose-phosphate aldolase
MANHGMVAGGAGLEKAMWRAQELEALARQYYLASQLGEPVLLSAEEIEKNLKLFAGYGPQDA